MSSNSTHYISESDSVILVLLIIVGSMNLEGLGDIDWDRLFSIPKAYWTENIQEEIDFLEEQVSTDLPEKIRQQLEAQKARIAAI